MSKVHDAIKLAHLKGYRVLENGDVINANGRRRKLTPDSYNYLRFNISLPDKTSFPIPVHRLVAYQQFGEAAFALGEDTRHLDGNSLNNYGGNIAMGTKRQNMLGIPEPDRIRHAQKGGAAGRKFTADEIVQIRAEHAAGSSYKTLMKKWGGSKSTFSYIISAQAKRQALY